MAATNKKIQKVNNTLLKFKLQESSHLDLLHSDAKFAASLFTLKNLLGMKMSELEAIQALTGLKVYLRVI